MASVAESDPRHPIGVVCRRTGLKPDLIRAWERRYGAVRPGRSDTRRRLYSDADIERLRLLRQAISAGRGIRHVASLPKEELLELIAADRADIGSTPQPAARPAAAVPSGTRAPVTALFASCLEAVQRLDEPELALALQHASVSLSRVDLLELLIVPLMHRIGELWKAGELRPIHEHLATAAVRSFLGSTPSRPASSGAPHILVTTPAGQHHELGALLVADCAAQEGWRVTYLGTDLPASEIAAAGLQNSVRAVALSITFPPGDPSLSAELVRLRQLLPPPIEIFVGGRSAAGYASTLDEISARRPECLKALRTELESLRRSP